MAKHMQEEENLSAARQVHGSDEEAWVRQDDASLSTVLPDELADEMVQQADLTDEDAASVADDDSANTAVPLNEENIGLGHIAGIDEAEVGREMNVEGDEDNDEDDNGNPIDFLHEGKA